MCIKWWADDHNSCSYIEPCFSLLDCGNKAPHTDNRNVLSHGFGGSKSRIKVLELFLPEGGKGECAPGLPLVSGGLVADIASPSSLTCRHVSLTSVFMLAWCSPCVYVCGQTSLLMRTMVTWDEGPPPIWSHPKWTNSSIMTLFPNKSPL